MVEAKPDSVAVDLRHVNPVFDYFVYSKGDRCFVCRSDIKDGQFPYPGVDLNLKREEDMVSLRFLFGALNSSASAWTCDVPPNSHSGFVAACNEHRPHLEMLRANLRDTKKITVDTLQAALRGPVPTST